MVKARYKNELYHHGIKGQKWGVRRYQYEDGSLTPEGRARYRVSRPEATGSKKDFSRDARSMLSSMYAMDSESAVNAIYNLEHGAEYDFRIRDVGGNKRTGSVYDVEANLRGNNPAKKVAEHQEELTRDVKERGQILADLDENDKDYEYNRKYLAKLDKSIAKHQKAIDNYGTELVKIADGIAKGKYDKYIDRSITNEVAEEMASNIKRQIANDRANRTAAVVLGLAAPILAYGAAKFITGTVNPLIGNIKRSHNKNRDRVEVVFDDGFEYDKFEPDRFEYDKFVYDTVDANYSDAKNDAIRRLNK